MFPDEVDDLVTISSAARATPFAIAIRSVQREAIRSDPEWKGGAYAPDAGPATGLRLARKLGLITYRSAAEWRERFRRERVAVRDGREGASASSSRSRRTSRCTREVRGHLRRRTATSISRAAMDLFDVAEHGGSVEAGLARVRARRTLVVGVTTDFLFPLDQQEEIATGLRRAGRDVTFAPLAVDPGPRFLPRRHGPVLPGHRRLPGRRPDDGRTEAQHEAEKPKRSRSSERLRDLLPDLWALVAPRLAMLGAAASC